MLLHIVLFFDYFFHIYCNKCIFFRHTHLSATHKYAYVSMHISMLDCMDLYVTIFVCILPQVIDT